jgi:hypothetical protein
MGKTPKKGRISLLHIGHRRKGSPNAERNNGLGVLITAGSNKSAWDRTRLFVRGS